MALTPNLSLRKATVDDIEQLVTLRRMMFESMGIVDDALLAKGDIEATRYFHSKLPSGEFRGWVVEGKKEGIIGTGGLVIDHHPPGPKNLTGKSGYIMNIAVFPAFRCQGIATVIMKTILVWLRENHIPVSTLHYTDLGKPIYEKLGFTQSNYMSFVL